MGKQIQRLILAVAFILLATTVATAQDTQPSDSLVRLMKASSVQVERVDSINFRKTFDATFLHNGTYLICDTAVWNEATNIISATGNVKLIQGDAVLTSATLDYFVEENVAKFRGSLVEMTDKDKNTLRTNRLDYYTKDSVARYDDGAVLKDHQGQIIESKIGTYDNTDRTFLFRNNVNMYTDSIFINTNELLYDAKTDMAYFEALTDFRRDDNILSALKGWYDRKNNLFFFHDNVHGISKEQELWSDSLYFFRDSQNIRLLGNARILDTVKNVSAIADYIFYEDSLSRITMKRDPAVRMITKQKDVVDTLYLRADIFEYHTVPYCELDSLIINDSKSRLEGISLDPVLQYRNKVAEEARSKAEAAKKQLEEEKYGKSGKPGKSREKIVDPEPSDEMPVDTLTVSQDTLALADSLVLEEPVIPDTTKIGFLTALRDIRMFKKDMQMCCDSVYYCDLDSIARIFGRPEIWNDGNRQYSADSIDLQILDSRPYKADLISGAFIVVEEEKGLCYDQIKGSEVVAYFDTTSTLSRFDALGGASAIFFLKENDVFATVNMVEAKMITAEFENGEISKVTYFEKPKNNVSPLAQMKETDKYLTGFKYSVENRPVNKESVTTREFPESNRLDFARHPNSRFRFSEKFFPGYIKGIRSEIVERKQQKEEHELDNPVAMVLPIEDSLGLDIPETVADTIIADSVAVREDLEVKMPDEGNEYEPEIKSRDKFARQQEREMARQMRIAARQARVAQKAEKRRLREEARKARREAKAAFIAARQQEREQKIFERYKKRYEKELLSREKADNVEDNL